jgi:AraC-like DNA-binding protein
MAAQEMTSVQVADSLLGLRADRELIAPDPSHSVRWLEHDYPSPVARWNYHPEYEIHLIRSGTGRFIVGDHVGAFDAGQVVLVGSGVPHDWVSDLEPGEVIPGRDAVIQFDGAWATACAALMPEFAEVTHLLEQSARCIQFHGQTAVAAAERIEAVGAGTGLARLANVLELFVVLARSGADDRQTLAAGWFRPDLDQQAAAMVEITLDYIFGNQSREIRLSVAAERVGMSESTFSKYFKRSVGQNFTEIVRKLRITHACRLLEQTTEPVSSICFTVGFSNLSNFNRQFRAEVGSTPQEYRSARRAMRQAAPS